MKQNTPTLTVALEKELAAFVHSSQADCPVRAAEAEALPELPEGWVRLHLVLDPDQTIIQLFGDAEDLLTQLVKRRGDACHAHHGLHFWKELARTSPPRLAEWPEASIFWAGPWDENEGRFVVYTVPQNSGINYLAGYEGPGSAADDDWDYKDLSGTPSGAADKGFPVHWHNTAREPWDAFLAAAAQENP